MSTRSLEYRTRGEQLTNDTASDALISVIRSYFSGKAHLFEHCAAAIAKMMIPEIVSLDVTRPSKDGGRDAIGKMRIGSGPSAILVDFALEAKCYTPPNAVGVRDISRLISRLRHRQFGVMVTTSCLDLQAYREIKEDEHPIVVISALDIVEIMRRTGRSTPQEVLTWLTAEFPRQD